MDRGDWLVIVLGLIACGFMIAIIDWRGMYDVFTKSIQFHVYGR